MAFNSIDHSILGEIRPRFFLKSHASIDELTEAILTGLEKDPTVHGQKSKDLILLQIPTADQHYWSPELSVRITTNEFIDYTRVSCLAGPKQSVWLMFTFFYAFISILTAFGGMFGMVKYSTSGTTGWLWTMPIGLLILSSVFFAAKFGQKKGRDQTLHLVSFLYHSLAEKGEVERVERR